jgi:hypothetical protein
MLGHRETRRSSAGWRLGWAGALTAALVAGLAATGGAVYAASAIEQATHAVRATHSEPTLTPVVAPVSSACSQYAVAPIITSISPTSGRVGSLVYIVGSNFTDVESVTFIDGVSASFTIVDDSHITATVPVGAHAVVITVSNCKGSAPTGIYTVVTSSKKHFCRVPNVHGMRLKHAQQVIAHARCRSRVHKIHSHVGHSSGSKFWYVIAQSKKPGKKVPLGTIIVLTARHPGSVAPEILH